MRIEAIESNRIFLKNVIKGCYEIIELNLKIDLLTAEISKRQSRRNVLWNLQYAKRKWIEYQGFSNIEYQVVLRETFRQLEIIQSVLKFFPSLGLVQKISNIEAIINIFKNFVSTKISTSLTIEKELNFSYFLMYFLLEVLVYFSVQLELSTEISLRP